MPVKTSCPYCGVGCGVIADRDAAGAVTVRGDPLHPANFGRLCGKGSALAETIGLDGRLLAPVVNGQEASWDAALDHVAEGFGRIVREHGPDSVAFYVSGQILTEDYYVINKLAKGFIGTANIDTNSRLCMASSVAGHKRAFGSDTVPGCYEDLETADLLVLVGSNAAWCHPILYQRMVAAKANNPACRIVVIDPRRTATCDGADLHLPLRSGSDSCCSTGCSRIWHRATPSTARSWTDPPPAPKPRCNRLPARRLHRPPTSAVWPRARWRCSSTGSPKPSGSSRSIHRASTSRAAASTRSMRSSTVIC